MGYWKNIFIILLATFIVPRVYGTNFSDIGEKPFVINYKQQEIDFFIDKNQEVIATISVEMDVQANSSLDKLYTNSIFVDDYSDIETIHYQDGKRKRKIKFKLSDYEIDGIFHSDAKVCYFDHKFEREGQVLSLIHI